MSVKPYGAFVDIGGASGLLHISQISHDRITNVEKVLSEGDRIKASKAMGWAHVRAGRGLGCKPGLGGLRTGVGWDGGKGETL